MSEWIKATFWAAATAGALLLLDPEAATLSGFLSDTAMLTAPMWLAVRLEERAGGCALKGIFS